MVRTDGAHGQNRQGRQNRPNKQEQDNLTCVPKTCHTFKLCGNSIRLLTFVRMTQVVDCSVSTPLQSWQRGRQADRLETVGLTWKAWQARQLLRMSTQGQKGRRRDWQTAGQTGQMIDRNTVWRWSGQPDRRETSLIRSRQLPSSCERYRQTSVYSVTITCVLLSPIVETVKICSLDYHQTRKCKSL